MIQASGSEVKPDRLHPVIEESAAQSAAGLAVQRPGLAGQCPEAFFSDWSKVYNSGIAAGSGWPPDAARGNPFKQQQRADDCG